MKQYLMNIKKGGAILASFFVTRLFPKTCFVCSTEGEWLCPDCMPRIPLAQSGICLFCGLPAPLGVCDKCRPNGLDAFSVSLDYRYRPIAKSISAYKYRFARDIGQTLSPLIAENFNSFLKICDSLPKKPYWLNKRLLVIPVPLYSRRENWRGFNQSAELASLFALEADYEYSDNLKKIRNTPTQAKLGASQRQVNLNGVYEWRGPALDDRVIVLVDDIATTGSTLSAAASCLMLNGAKTIIGLTLAR